MHGDLLAQARHLATPAARRPKQASLRRAVSTAYYAIFHLLVRAATEHLLRGAGLAPFRGGLGRAFTHADMRRASISFLGGTVPVFGAIAVPGPLGTVARAFVDLQDGRHRADYDLSTRFSRAEALASVERAELAFHAWEEVRRQDVASLYLTALLVHARLAGRCPAGRPGRARGAARAGTTAGSSAATRRA